MSLRHAIEEAARGRLLRASGAVRGLLRRPADPPALAEYDLMRADNARAADVYQPGAFWSEINRDFQSLIWAGALSNLRDEYFSRRFADPGPGSFQIYAALMHVYYRKLQDRAPELLEHLSDPDVGRSSSVVSIDNKAVSIDLLQSAEEIMSIREALRTSGMPDPSVIVELGAGYGRLAYACRQIWPRCSYLIVDLPEALACAHAWLSRAVPDAVVPYSRTRDLGDLDRRITDKPGIWLCGAQDVQRLAPLLADVFVNIYSLAEMPRSSVVNYYAHIARVTRGVFYTKQRAIERNSSDDTVNEVGSYPELRGASLVYRRNALLYQGVVEEAWHFGGESGSDAELTGAQR